MEECLHPYIHSWASAVDCGRCQEDRSSTEVCVCSTTLPYGLLWTFPHTCFPSRGYEKNIWQMVLKEEEIYSDSQSWVQFIISGKAWGNQEVDRDKY